MADYENDIDKLKQGDTEGIFYQGITGMDLSKGREEGANDISSEDDEGSEEEEEESDSDDADEAKKNGNALSHNYCLCCQGYVDWRILYIIYRA